MAAAEKAPYLLDQPMTARFATATGLLVGASLTTAAVAVADPGDTVTYTVNSDGPLVSVSYYDEMDNMRQVTDQPANWSTTFTSEATSGLFAVGRDALANCSAPIYVTPSPSAAPYAQGCGHRFGIASAAGRIGKYAHASPPSAPHAGG